VTIMARVAGLCLAATVLLGGLSPALAEVGRDEAAQDIAERYGVEVLKVREGEVDGVPAWLVTVMFPGGNFNSAFQVQTLAVDKQSGDLIPAFRHGTSGYQLPDRFSGSPRSGSDPTQMNRGIWR
jgi:hypothetical protein